jgi:hypothetical protein
VAHPDERLGVEVAASRADKAGEHRAELVGRGFGVVTQYDRNRPDDLEVPGRAPCSRAGGAQRQRIAVMAVPVR